MAITIELGPEKEARLSEKAAHLGQNADEYIYELVSERLAEPETENREDLSPAPAEEATLAELFAGRTGLVDSEGRFNYSDHTGKAYSESLLAQTRANTQENKP